MLKQVGRLWTPAHTPTDRLTSLGLLYHPCTVPVYKLLFIRQYTSAVVPLVSLASTRPPMVTVNV
jgi:hypothetical protein